jgi:ABC-type multidrug transport system fused ATPase/permease subunit
MLGTVVAGRVAAQPTAAQVSLLAALLVGAVLLDTGGRTLFARMTARAEGRLRADLLDAALGQPLPVLEEQAVGELLDRVDDDPRQLGVLARRTGWEMARAGLRVALAWVVAGFTWWPAWFAFPAVGALTLAVARPLTGEVARRKQREEVAWSDHSAQLEEAIAGRDDVRSSLGQAHVVRAYAERARTVLHRVMLTNQLSAVVTRRIGLVLQGMLAALALAGVGLVAGGHLDVARLVTLWLLVTAFVGQLTQASHHLPELQAGLGALARARTLLQAPREPVGGITFPPGPASVEFRELSFRYPGGFALQSVTLTVPAGTTCALVGRSGAGKSTLAKLVSRAVEPPAGTVLVGGCDVTRLDIDSLRASVGMVTQRTEILAATVEQNVTLLADIPHARVEQAIAALGLTDWVNALPDGLATRLGPGGLTLSAGEEQLVAFARLLVRDVSVVILDEATARMDPVTEGLVTRAADRLLAGRTGLVIAHRLSTTRRADTVAVLDGGKLVQHGPRAALARQAGPYRDLLVAAGDTSVAAGDSSRAAPADAPDEAPDRRGSQVGRMTARAGRPAPLTPTPPVPPAVLRPRLARTLARMLVAYPKWGSVGAAAFMISSLIGTYGVLTGLLWGRVVADLGRGETPWLLAGLLAGLLLAAPFVLAVAFRTYITWWSAVTLRVRLPVLVGQTRQRRLPRTAPGEAVARSLDSDRLLMYADRWVDVVNGVLVAVVTAVAGRSLLAGGVIAAILALSAVVSAFGAPVAGRTARVAGDERARFGQELASVLDTVRTLKLAATVQDAKAHVARADARRVLAVVRESVVRALLDGVPWLLVQLGVVAGWAVYLVGGGDLATAILVTTTASGLSWFATVAGAVVTEAPVARRWLQAMAALAGTDDLVGAPEGVDLVTGTAPAPLAPQRVPLQRLTLEGVTAVHDDGTVGVSGVDLTVRAGELVLLVGRVGSGKSSLLAALAGLVDHQGLIRWNDTLVHDAQTFLRPGQVAYVAQVPRVLSGSWSDNITLDHDRPWQQAVQDARLEADVAAAGGHQTLVGHGGVRLSGGQVQRLALARARATGAELLVADDVSSALDAHTELELWEGLRARGVTVVGATSKQAALARADRVVVLDQGRVAASGPWSALVDEWGHLAS